MSLVFKGIYLGGGGGGSANLTTLDVTPMTNYQSISPEEGYDGFSLVNVSAVNSSIDPNITAANIVNGVNILGVIGTASASAPKEVAKYKIDANGVAVPNDQDITGMFNDIVGIQGQSLINVGSHAGMEYAFYNSSITGNVAFPNCITVGTQGLNGAFANTNITSINMPALTYASVNSFYQLARGCRQLTSVSYDALTETSTNSFLVAFQNSGSPNGFSVSMGNLIDAGGASPFNYAFQNSNITSINLGSLQYLNGSQTFYYAFDNTKMIKEFLLPNLIHANSYQNASHFYRAFNNSNIERIIMPASKTCSNQMFAEMCINCINLTSLDVGTIKLDSVRAGLFQGVCQNCMNLANFNVGFAPNTVGWQPSIGAIFNNSFRNCTSLETLNLSSWGFAISVESGSYGAIGNMCCDCINLSSVNLFSRRHGFDQYCGNAFRNCYNLKELEFTSLVSVSSASSGFVNVCADSYITNLSFPSILSSADAGFTNMLRNVVGCTVHFPASSEATISTYSSTLAGFGGTNTTVLFDLPAVAEAQAIGNMAANGEIGGEDFAVTASSGTSNAFTVFNTSTSYWRPETAATTEAPQNIVFYTPNPTRLTLIQFTRPGALFAGGNWSHSSYKFYGSNDNSSWEIVNTIPGPDLQAGQTQSTTIGAQVMCNNFYKYYKLEFYANRPGVQQIYYIGLQHNA